MSNRVSMKIGTVPDPDGKVRVVLGFGATGNELQLSLSPEVAEEYAKTIIGAAGKARERDAELRSEQKKSLN